ncbi:hypothetical protein LV84_02941 [Algoriphagus ratkowskyi]|uniref:Lipoprotein n=1 Tax=Algoriphagus ratkowskyi TaxID=57028 RepID=A0A2W7QZ63_9BACT|nr:hypothetical protein [Algoriphagus ratkowskyi]PZX53833.1 hypothetical protein LV84_02941 [Algoriphagus ratkowskyi]TXD76762.1 hypothetical protein ESW18_15475 [Algoriphagus ratkowskyi]
MKSNLFLSLATIAVLTVSCGEKSDSAYEDSVEAQNKMSGEMHKSDTNIVKHDGTLLPEAMDQTQSIELPSKVLEVIDNDNALSVDKITSKRKFEENSITYYEVTFMVKGEQSITMVYDEDGKRKSSN